MEFGKLSNPGRAAAITAGIPVRGGEGTALACVNVGLLLRLR
jgi:hypothetical protein